jgi:hypothetical protein
LPDFLFSPIAFLASAVNFSISGISAARSVSQLFGKQAAESPIDIAAGGSTDSPDNDRSSFDLSTIFVSSLSLSL